MKKKKSNKKLILIILLILLLLIVIIIIIVILFIFGRKKNSDLYDNDPIIETCKPIFSNIKNKVIYYSENKPFFFTQGIYTMNIGNEWIYKIENENGQKISNLSTLENIKNYEFDCNIKLTGNCSYFFRPFYIKKGCCEIYNPFMGVKNINLRNVDTTEVTNMDFIFENMELTSLNVSTFNTSKVTSMHGMFDALIFLKFLDVSNFDTSKVTNMRLMFCNLRSIESLHLSNFNTSKVIDMEYMFAKLHNVNSLDLSNFDTSQVMNVDYMFYDLINIQSIYLPTDFKINNSLNIFSFVNENCSLYNKLNNGSLIYLGECIPENINRAVE